MAKIKKSTLKIIAATMMSIFSLASVFSATIAWFNLMQNTAGGADRMPVIDQDGLLKRVTFHDLNAEYTTASTYAFDGGNNIRGELVMNWATGELEGLDDVSISLDRYDPLNQSHPLLMLFEFNKATPGYAVEIKATTETNDFVGYIENANGNPLSSVVQHSSIYFTAAPSLVNGTIQFAKSSLSEAGHFSNIVFDELGYPIIDAEHGFESEQYFFKNSSLQTEILYVGVVIDYYEDAMSYLYSINLGNPLFEADATNEDAGVINFICDWTTVI